MIYIIIGLILVGIVLYIVGFFARKKYYTYIDKLESWKIEIMNRSAMEEVGKIKEVKMTGEAEECFEQWRKAWDRVISNDLPNVEEWLYDAEESVDKFRFSQAKEIFVKIEEGLKACETKIQKHVDQMQKVIESEEKNREEIQTIVETYKQLKKNYWHTNMHLVKQVYS